MTTFDTYATNRNSHEFAHEPLVFQSEYYNVYFQKIVEHLAGPASAKALLTQTAHEIAYAQFSKYFQGEELDVESRKKVVVGYYAHCGFGKIFLQSLSLKGGYVIARSEHYAAAWLKYFGKRPDDAPGISHFTTGFLCGAADAMFGVPPGTFDGRQSSCLAKGDEYSRFEIFRGLKKKLLQSPQLGKIQEERTTDLPLPGQKMIEEMQQHVVDGEIKDFDIRWTKHYANYFAMIKIKLLMQAGKNSGSSGVANMKRWLCTLHEQEIYTSFGHLMNSTFWHTQIAPLLGRESFVETLRACLALLSGLGHGGWALEAEAEQSYTFRITNHPEINAFLKLVGKTKAPIDFTALGTLKGLVTLLRQKPLPTAINMKQIKQLTGRSKHYTAKTLQSRMMGADQDLMRVEQLSGES